MSDDFRFDDDDFSFDDDDFSFDDDFEDEDADDFSYGDDSFDQADLDEDIFGADDEGDELVFLEEEESGGGPSRTFLLIAGLLIIILLAGVVLLVLALTQRPDPALVATRTAIAQANATTEELIRQTQTQSAINLGLTQTATLFTATPSPTPSPTATDTPDLTATAVVEQATQTADAQVELTSAALTSIALTSVGGATQVATEPPESTEEPGGISPVEAAQLTATALAGFFEQTPTVDVTTGAIPTIATTPGEMPDTGLFDEVGTENAGIFFLMAFGLLGVIFGSRRLRKSNKRKRR